MNNTLSFPGKLIICLRRNANKGKSSAILALADRLIPQSTRNPVWNIPAAAPAPPFPKHINMEVWVKGRHVGLDSHGDLPAVLLTNLGTLAGHSCDVIFCTCRSKV